MLTKLRYHKEILIWVFVALQFIDASLTAYVVSKGGIKYEANPVARFLMSYYPPLMVIVLTKIIAVVGGLFIYHEKYFKSLMVINLYYISAILVGLCAPYIVATQF